MPEELAPTALQQAFLSQPPTLELLVNYDRCGRYCGNAYRALPHEHGVLRSHSCRGDRYDNVQAESL